MKRLLIFPIWTLMTQMCLAQTKETTLHEEQYFKGQKEIAQSVSDFIYSDFSAFNSLPQQKFVEQIDSLESTFNVQLTKYLSKLSPEIVKEERTGIRYFFDRLLLEYPQHHYAYTGKRINLNKINQRRLLRHHKDFNNSSLLSNSDYHTYVQAFLQRERTIELRKEKYNSMDNQWLQATWLLIDKWFENQDVVEYWKQTYLFSHIDEMGIKNIEIIYQDFMRNCLNTNYTDKIRKIYEEHRRSRALNHIETYKTVEGFELEMHLFLPDTVEVKNSFPIIVYFHGGSWTTGKPDWFFDEAKHYNSLGIAAVAVEYRIGARHGSLPFESVKDARSAIRWLRENASRLNIDTKKIIATGNSAGGHLVLATALAENMNELSDKLDISPIPNALMITSGVFDLTVENAQWIQRAADNENTVLNISPNHLMKKEFPPTLIIHGSKDVNCPYYTAQYFVSEMQALGNEIEFHTIEGAGHFIWFGEFANEVGLARKQFLESLSFD